MAKTYEFIFSWNPAEFGANSMSVIHDGKSRFEELKTCTLKDAQAHLAVFSAGIEADHYAGFRLRNSNERAPAGYGDYRARHRAGGPGSRR